MDRSDAGWSSDEAGSRRVLGYLLMAYCQGPKTNRPGRQYYIVPKAASWRVLTAHKPSGSDLWGQVEELSLCCQDNNPDKKERQRKYAAPRFSGLWCREQLQVPQSAHVTWTTTFVTWGPPLCRRLDSGHITWDSWGNSRSPECCKRPSSALPRDLCFLRASRPATAAAAPRTTEPCRGRYGAQSESPGQNCSPCCTSISKF